MAPDLLWDDVRDLFDPELGRLPDAYVPSTTSQDWQRVVDLVRSSGMSYQYKEDRLDVLCGFLRAVGRELAKPVLVFAEGSRCPLVGYDPVADKVSRTAPTR